MPLSEVLLVGCGKSMSVTYAKNSIYFLNNKDNKQRPLVKKRLFQNANHVGEMMSMSSINLAIFYRSKCIICIEFIL